MDWSSLIEWSLAAGIAWRASKKMDEFKAMFQATLDKLAAQSEGHEKRVTRLEERVTQTNEAVAGLASVVAGALYEDDDDAGEPGPIN